MNMDWRDAMAVRCIARAFIDDEKAAGWPCVLEPEQLAVMQRPFQSNDRAGEASADALCDALAVAIDAGELEATTSVVRVQEVDSERTQQNRQWAQERGAVGYAKAYREVDQEIHLVTPRAFATWLAAQGMEPSRHIAAWLKVRGMQTVPAIEAQDVTDWLSLVRYRQQFAGVAAQRRPAWPSAHVALLAGQLQQAHAAGQQRGALGRLAKELQSTTRQSLSGLLQKHSYNTTTGQQAQTAANPFGQAQRQQRKRA